MMQDISRKEPSDPAMKVKLRMLDKTLEVASVFDSAVGKLSKMLDRHYTTFLPTSDIFTKFLDSLSQMKNHLSKLGPTAIFRPVYSLLVKNTELFNALAITLSSASFAPEYAGNQQIVAALLEAQQTSNQSIARLRVLLEEKESLLQQETQKLASLEEEYEQYKKSNHV